MIFSMILSLMMSPAWGATMDVHGYFPSVCTQGSHIKAAKVLGARITPLTTTYDVELDLALYECKGTTFTAYQPHPEEFLEVYQFEPDATDANRFAIPNNSDGNDYSHVSFQLPRSSTIKERAFRFDVFLYDTQIPYEITIQETGTSVRSALRAL